MAKELAERISVFLRYVAWMAIYALLYLGVSFVAAYGLDRLWPASFVLLGPPASLWRLGAFLLWSAVVTLVIWPVWHGLGDLFLPERGRSARLAAAWRSIRELRSALHKASGMAPRRKSPRYTLSLCVVAAGLAALFLALDPLASHPVTRTPSLDMLARLRSAFMILRDKGRALDEYPSLDILLADLPPEDAQYLRDKNVRLHPTGGNGDAQPFLEGYVWGKRETARVVLYADGSGSVMRE